MAASTRNFRIADNPTGTRQMLYFRLMISLEDARWSSMTGGYKMPFDPRPLLKRLETDSETTQVWHELWEELHHQGDVGEASFAAVPFLVDACRKRGDLNWNTYAIVAIIELARKNGTNPDVPGWIAEDYFQSIENLAEVATTRVLRAETPEDVRAMLGIIAIAKGLRIHGRFLVDYSENELIEIESGKWIPNPVTGAKGGTGGGEEKD